ncbi:MAG: D-glycero-alpha-D-manno-heptose-1,7-bisphosphate 7-phosphatase [Kiloniellales bacterium]
MPDRGKQGKAGSDPEEVGEGIWVEVLPPDRVPGFAGKPALFLDRDGVVVEDVGYLHRPGDLHLLSGAADLLARAAERGLPRVLVTNQSGIGRGLYDWSDFRLIQRAILEALEEAAPGAGFDLVLACPFHAEAKPPYRHPNHPFRKPNPGMLLHAGRLFGLDLARSWIVGDRALDLAAGRAAGLAGGLLIVGAADNGEQDAVERLARPDFEVRVGESLAAALALPLFGAR